MIRLGMRRLFCLALLMVPGVSPAQDTRSVSEPVVPPVCAALVATATFAAAPGQADDTFRIQRALDTCQRGHAVRLASGVDGSKSAFNAGPLTLKSGVTLLVDAGVTLYASTDSRAYDKGQRSCGSNDASGKGCKALISADATTGSGIMGGGTIDGQGGQLIAGKTETWWQIARRAQKEKTRQNVPRLIEILNSRDFTLYRITLRNSPNFHVTLNRVDGFTAWGVKIDTPSDARNTDGIDPISSRNVTIAHSFIRTGDDNVAIKAGHNGPSENISIIHNHFYNGHGMSIGSETEGGVRNVLVEHLSMDGSTSGLRIKSDVSRGGQVRNVRYRHVCMRNVRAPLDIDTRYDRTATGNKIPVYRDISFEHIRSHTPGRIILRGIDADHPLIAKLNDVVIDGNPTMQLANANLSVGPGPVSLMLNGEGVQVTGTSSAGTGKPCDTSFVSFPTGDIVAKSNPRRPQLTAAQALAFSHAEVLKYSGMIGAETIDPWDPLSDPLVKNAPLKPDYTVDAAANADGKAIFNSVQAAISKAVGDSAATGSKNRMFVLIKPGVYRELVYVPASTAPITLYSNDENAANTRISADLHAGAPGESYTNRFGAQFINAEPSITAMYESLKDKPIVATQGSAIAWIRNNGFQAKNITFENTWNRGPVVQPVPTAIATQLVQTFNQAVAVMVEDADKVQFENVRFVGYQDTLFLTASALDRIVRSFFHKSYIEGDTDFIFGNATAYFYRSEIKSLGERKSISYATAPSTNAHSKFGFVFNECKFTNDGTPNALAGKFALARQWFRGQRCTPYGNVAEIAGYSCRVGDADIVSTVASTAGSITKGVIESVGKVVILNSSIGVHIDQARPWLDWNKPGARQYRPAQFNSDDFWRNLVDAGIEPLRQLGYLGKKTPVEPYLAEFNNRDE